MECRRASPFFELPDGICETCTVLEWIFHHTYMAGRQAVLGWAPGSKFQAPIPRGLCQSGSSVTLSSAIPFLQSISFISGICSHPLMSMKILRAILLISSKTLMQVLCQTETSGPWTTQRAMLETVEKMDVQKLAVSHWQQHWHIWILGSYVLKNAVSHHCLHMHC